MSRIKSIIFTVLTLGVSYVIVTFLVIACSPRQPLDSLSRELLKGYVQNFNALWENSEQINCSYSLVGNKSVLNRLERLESAEKTLQLNYGCASVITYVYPKQIKISIARPSPKLPYIYKRLLKQIEVDVNQLIRVGRKDMIVRQLDSETTIITCWDKEKIFIHFITC